MVDVPVLPSTVIRSVEDLPALSGASSAVEDLIMVYDVSEAQFKKFTRTELLAALLSNEGVVITDSVLVLTAAHNFKTLRFDNAGDVTLYAPPGLQIGFRCGIVQTGAGQVTVMEGEGVTINAPDGVRTTAVQFARAAIECTGENTYDLDGTLE